MKKSHWIILIILVVASIFSYFFIVRPACKGLEGAEYTKCMEQFMTYED